MVILPCVFLYFLKFIPYIYIYTHTHTYIYMTVIKNNQGTSLVAHWLGVCLPMQGTWVRALAREDPTCCGAAKPLRHDC